MIKGILSWKPWGKHTSEDLVNCIHLEATRIGSCLFSHKSYQYYFIFDFLGIRLVGFILI